MPATVNAGRASYAYQCVQNIIEDPQVINSEYKSYVKSFPLLIKANGFGQALAFCKVKAGKNAAYEKIITQIKNHLTQQHCISGNSGTLLSTIINMEHIAYYRCTLEVMRLFGWLRRFAEEAIAEEGGN